MHHLKRPPIQTTIKMTTDFIMMPQPIVFPLPVYISIYSKLTN